MTPTRHIPITPRLEEAIVELRELIAGHYPDATFTVSDGEDPDGIYLTATVDVEDMGEVVDVFSTAWLICRSTKNYRYMSSRSVHWHATWPSLPDSKLPRYACRLLKRPLAISLGTGP